MASNHCCIQSPSPRFHTNKPAVISSFYTFEWADNGRTLLAVRGFWLFSRIAGIMRDFFSFLMFCFLGALEAVISSSLLQVEKHRCIKQGGKRQQGAAIERLSTVWEKQVISALFHARLHIFSTCALLHFFSFVPISFMQ